MNTITNSLILDKVCLEAARKQFCLDIGLPWEAYCFNKTQKVFICKSVYKKDSLDIASEGARNYSGRSAFFRAIICLGQLFITCDESIYDWVVEQYGQYKAEWFCGFRNLRKLDEKLREHGQHIYDTHVYFLPEAEDTKCFDRYAKNETLRPVSNEKACDGQELVWFEQEEVLRFKENNRFTSALSFWEGQPDMLAVAWRKVSNATQQRENDLSASQKDFDQSHMSGMAGASGDGAYLWQIGINVDEECAGQGVGHRLVRALKEEILRRGKVPFYGTSESHTVSQTVGLKAGFAPAWTEVLVERIPVNMAEKV